MSQSTTDTGVCIELPGEVTIGATEPVRRNAETSEVVRPNAETAEPVRRYVEKARIEHVIVGDPEGVLGEAMSTGGIATTGGIIGVNITGQRQLADGDLEIQRATRITAAESLLRDELRKPNPSQVSLAAFRQVAYGDAHGDGGMGEPKPSIGRSVVEEDKREEGKNVLLTGVRPTDDDRPMEVEEGVVETEVTTVDEGEIVLSDDAAMSVGDSEEDETGTDGCSGVDRSSSHG